MAQCSTALDWSAKTFSELSLNELYDILHLRSEIFIIEQNCIYPDLDYRDQHCTHIMARNAGGELVAYLRVLPEGLEAPGHGSLGRVVVRKDYRHTGLGRQLFAKGLEMYDIIAGRDTPILLHAQAYLQNFYSSFGFKPIDEPHQFEGLPHIHMLRSNNC